MKCTTINVTPSNFESSFARVKAVFSTKGEHEVTMSFAGGSYNLTSPIFIDAAEFPAKAHLRMIGGGRIKTVFSAVRELPTGSFTRVENKPYYVYQFEKAADGTYPNLRSLYVNGKSVEISRTAEYRSTPPFSKDNVDYAATQKIFNETHKIYVPMSAINEAGLENCAGAELHIRVEWNFRLLHIVGIDIDDFWIDGNGEKQVAMLIRENENMAGPHWLAVYDRAFFISNTTSVLTTPGKYAYERAVGRLYYYPDGKIEDCHFTVGCLTNLFELNNFASLTLQKLTFTQIEDDILTNAGYYAAGQAGAWGEKFKERFPHAGALRINNVGSADINGCRFTELPCDGISMVGLLDNITIRNSRFTNIGASAIRVGRPLDYSETDQINNIRIANNYLDNIGFTYENSCSILLTKVKGGTVNHNTILRSSYSAISLGWKWDVANWEYGEQVNLENVEIAYNYIKSFVMNMRDGGGIYTLGGNAPVSHAPFINRLHDNVVIEDELTCPENGFFSALYHDGASSNWHTYNNIVVHNPDLCGVAPHYSGRIYLQGNNKPVGSASTEGQATWHILCENNYICGCKDFGEIFRSQASDPEKASTMLDSSRDLREKDTHMLKSPKELKKYPEAVRIMRESGCSADVGKK